MIAVLWVLLTAGMCSVAAAEPAEAEPAEAEPTSAAPSEQPFSDWAARQRVEPHPEPHYHFAAEVFHAIADAAAARPGVIEAQRLGESLAHRPIWAFSVHDTAFPVQKRLLLIANIHAMEWVPTEDALAFLLDYAAQPEPGVEVVIVPILNPDGRARVEADLVAGRNLYRRGNEAQVDLNRDWSVNRESKAIWRHLIPGRYTTSPAALSQPETRAVDHLLRNAGDVPFSGFVSLHSFGGFIYYPWAGLFERAPDWRRMHAIAKTMHDGMGTHPYKPLQLSRWAFFFRGLGMEIDHVYGEFGIPAFLVETTRSGIEGLPDLHTYFRWYNPREPARHVKAGLGMLRAWVTAEPLIQAMTREPLADLPGSTK